MGKNGKDQPKNAWVTQNETLLHRTPVMDLWSRTCRSTESQKEHEFYVLKATDWVNIIPVTSEGKVVLVRQFRIGIGEHSLEIPGGICDPDEKDPSITALRELAEETGYVPTAEARCVYLGWAHANPAIFDNKTHSYIVGPVQKNGAQNLDPSEMIDIVEVEIDEIPRLILEGKITHSLILNAFLLLASRSQSWAELVGKELNSIASAAGTT